MTYRVIRQLCKTITTICITLGTLKNIIKKKRVYMKNIIKAVLIILAILSFTMGSIKLNSSIYDTDLVVSKTDILIANTVCTDRGGVKEVEVGGYFTCNNGETGDESMLLELSNINVVTTLSN